MNAFILKICFIFCLLQISYGNITTSSNNNNNNFNDNDTRILPGTKLMAPTDALTYYITGGHRRENKLKYVNYMVSIRTRSPVKYFGDNHYCAGTIISENTVLTAAHCVMDKRRVLYPARRLLLVAGTPNRLQPIGTTKQFPVKTIKANTKFVRKNEHDVAIIRLKNKIPENNRRIKIMPLPKRPPTYNTTCTVLGWGRMIAQGPMAANPLHIEVRILYPAECEKLIGSHYYEGVLCADDSTARSDATCRGDTGGPLICNETLTGIISWTIACGNTTNPSLFMDVFYHKKWIEDFLNSAARLDLNISLFIFVAAIVWV